MSETLQPGRIAAVNQGAVEVQQSSPELAASQAQRPLRVMQLVPGARQPGRLTALTLMDEELLALHRRGVELHTIVHEMLGEPSPAMREHVIPRIRNLAHSCGSLRDCIRYLGSDAYTTTSLGERFLLARVQRWVARVVREHELSVIHSHWARPCGSAAAAAKIKTGVPLVITLRGADVLNEPSIGYGNTLDPLYNRRLRFAFGVTDRVICVSTTIAERAIELGADPSRTLVVHKGVDVDRFHPGSQATARQRLELPDRPTILFVGALERWKGVSDLLDAYRIIRERISDAQLILCGKGQLRDEIREFITAHQLTGSVRLAGHIDRDLLPTFFQACDAFVLPSLTEGSGNVLLEAAACGKPTVGTRVGGIPDYIVDGQTGLLCEKRDPADLADKLLMLLVDSTSAQKLGEQGFERVNGQFRYDQMVDRILQVYRSVTAGHN